MKDLDPKYSAPDGKIKSEQRQVIKQRQLTGRLIIKPGQTVFEYDLATEECRPATIEQTNAVLADHSKPRMKNNVMVHREVKRKPDHLYCASLNKANAERKFSKMLADLVAKGILIKT